MSDTSPADTPLHWLGDFGRRYPGAWEGFERMRGLRGTELPTWPDWCYAPIAAGIAAATDGAEMASWTPQQLKAMRDAPMLVALAAWRMGKGVYVVDPDLLEALWDTPVTGNIPSEVLRHLPEWCVYVHLDRKLGGGRHLQGAFVHLEYDPNDGSSELRLVLAYSRRLEAHAIDLGGTLDEGIASMLDDGIMRGQSMIPARLRKAAAEELRRIVEPLVSVALYLASEAREFDGDGRPGNPRPTKTKAGWRTFPQSAPRRWDVGVRIGAALRAANDELRSYGGESGSGRARMRPHLRRAHWTFRWTGPRTSVQEAKSIWMRPRLIAAGDSDEELPAVIHAVEVEPD